jgi:hypothetical protein
VSYCSDADVYLFGVPRGSVPNPGRPLYSLVSDVCTLDAHGFETEDPIQFRAAGDGSLPAGLAAGTTYYAQRQSESTFKVRATPTGSALTITTATDPVLVLEVLDIASARAFADAVIDDVLTGHVVPLSPVPQIIRITAAELSAGKLLAGKGAQSKSLAEVVDAAVKRLERWREGKPVEGASEDSRTNLASPGAASTAGVCSRASQWRRLGGF